jgi:hypothetical protein
MEKTANARCTNLVGGPVSIRATLIVKKGHAYFSTSSNNYTRETRSALSYYIKPILEGRLFVLEKRY